jgi:hypothetical protein
MAAVRTGEPGSVASARRALRWFGRVFGTLREVDRTRHSRRCGGVDDCVPDVCKFMCRGCLRWWPMEAGAAEDGASGYACDACALAIHREVT